jgi:hypothetical protein
MNPALVTVERRVAPVDPAFAASPTSSDWLEALRGTGSGHDRAVERLHEVLLGAARFEVSRRHAALSYVRGDELEDIATQAADERLNTTRGALYKTVHDARAKLRHVLADQGLSVEGH